MELTTLVLVLAAIALLLFIVRRCPPAPAPPAGVPSPRVAVG